MNESLKHAISRILDTNSCSHKNFCKHKVKYCGGCQNVYCVKCTQIWVQPTATSGEWVNNTYPSRQDYDTTGTPQPRLLTIFCENH